MRHIDRFRDRHGHWRYYFRRPGGPRTKLPGAPGSLEFLEAYQAALGASLEPGKPLPATGGARTFDALLRAYFSSADYLGLAASTRYASRKAIERIVRDDGLGPRVIGQMRREHVMTIVAKRSATPGAATDALKKIRTLVRFAIRLGWRTDDPTLLVRGFKSGEWHTWTEEEVAQFEAHWKPGTLERTAFALFLYTGQRLSDVVHMSWRDVDAGRIEVVQEKTDEKLAIPLHLQLAEALSAAPRRHVTILINGLGKAFTTKGFGNFMADAIGRAGLPDRCVTHGIRKAAARRLAEAGCSEKEIASITGHRTLKEVARYTRAASQKRLADAAVARLTEHGGNTQLPTRLPTQSDARGKKG